MRLVFVDGRYVPALSDATEGSGYEVSINDDRQGLPDAIQAEVFLHLTESLAQSVTPYRREARSTAGKAIAVDAYHPGRGR
ncbi:component of SufBCD complex [Escherichia coli]|uniref:Component of SufBCD complex n=1 Tax=Escherichia coli TaxID=562 RepID=A0A376W5M1_ECOLX|nr:component of SufBCD complex [Escherichia coli]